MAARFALVAVLAAVFAAPAGAATGGYPAAYAPCRWNGAVYGPCTDFAWGYRAHDGSWSLISKRGFDYRNCTDYVAWKLKLTWGDFHFSGRGDASLWRAHAARIGRIATQTPHLGDIAWWPASSSEPEGHVGIVVALGPAGTARVAEYNYDGYGRYDVRTTYAPAYLHHP